MSAFGALPLEVEAIPYTAMVSSANKCIEGVPGFGFVIARKAELAAAKGRCHSLSLDLHAQWAYVDTTGQWRYTPPTHVVAAFLQAMDEHAAGGSVGGRGRRYPETHHVWQIGSGACRAQRGKVLTNKRG